MPVSDPIRVGVIGVGWWSNHAHIPGIVAHPAATLTAVCARTESKARETAAQFAAAAAFTDHRRMLDEAALDAVVITASNRYHHPLVMDCLARGLHVFCEKPLAVTLAEAIQMEAAATQAGVKHMVAFTNRFVPHAILAKQMLEAGEIGRIEQVNATRMAAYGAAGGGMNWRFDIAESGGGVLYDLGCHVIDATRWLCGEFLGLGGVVRNTVAERRAADGSMTHCTVDDIVAFTALVGDGCPAAFHVTWASHGARTQRIEVCGSEGVLVLETDADAWHNRVRLCRRGEPDLREVPIPAELMAGIDESTPEAAVRSFIANTSVMSRRFIDVIVNDEAPSPSFTDGLRAQEVMTALETSSRERRWVELPR